MHTHTHIYTCARSHERAHPHHCQVRNSIPQLLLVKSGPPKNRKRTAHHQDGLAMEVRERERVCVCVCVRRTTASTQQAMRVAVLCLVAFLACVAVLSKADSLHVCLPLSLTPTHSTALVSHTETTPPLQRLCEDTPLLLCSLLLLMTHFSALHLRACVCVCVCVSVHTDVGWMGGVRLSPSLWKDALHTLNTPPLLVASLSLSLYVPVSCVSFVLHVHCFSHTSHPCPPSCMGGFSIPHVSVCGYWKACWSMCVMCGKGCWSVICTCLGWLDTCAEY